MRTVTVDIKNNSPVTAYFDATTTGAKSVRNTANFLIRNTMTGIQKSPEERNRVSGNKLHNRKSVASNVRHRERKNRQYELNDAFGKKRKYRYELAA